jgi:hypothetical protein
MSFNSSYVEIAIIKTEGQLSRSSIVGDAVFRTIGPRKLLLQSGSEDTALCIDENNNIGIGKTNPQCALDISGNVNISGTLQTTGDITIKSANENNLLYIDNINGRVGINTTYPTSSLHVKGLYNTTSTLSKCFLYVSNLSKKLFNVK